ncbi:MAG: hypothetical protein ACE1ZS_05180, partial [Candidatus Poribacteria bacterium]
MHRGVNHWTVAEVAKLREISEFCANSATKAVYELLPCSTRTSKQSKGTGLMKITDIECFVLLAPDFDAEACSSAQDN